MRKLGLCSAALGVSLALLWGSASAAQAASFSVFGEPRGDGNGGRNSFVFHEKLLTDDGFHVGTLRVEFTRTGRRALDVKALFRFRGGKIRAAGPLPRGSNQTFPITGGKGRYHGITGRVKVRDADSGLDKFTFHFSR